MLVKIYLDVLIITNCVMTLVFLKCICRITHNDISNLRTALSALIGGLSSLIVALDTQGFFQAAAVTVLKILLITLIVFISFKPESVKAFAKYIFLYFFIELIFAGVSLFIWQITDSRIIYIKNYTVYFDISLIYLVIATIIIYAVIALYEWLVQYKFNRQEKFRAIYTLGNYSVELPAIADTGNKLCDPFSRLPIVIFYSGELYEHFNLDNEKLYPLGAFRIAPFSTVSGNSVIPITSKGSVSIIYSNGNRKSVRCCVGILHNHKNKARAIFNPCLLQ